MKGQLTNTLGPQKRILVVDDNELMRVVLSDSLSRFGYEVVTAGDGGEGYELLLQNRFDLVITDCQMPKIDGWHLVDLIKECRPYTPVLMITGQSQVETLEKMTTGQVDFLMFKPFEMEDLHHIVQSFLVNNSSERNTTKICKGGCPIKTQLEDGVYHLEISLEADMPGADLTAKPGGQVQVPLKGHMPTQKA